jgi:hypothetical protein
MSPASKDPVIAQHLPRLLVPRQIDRLQPAGSSDPSSSALVFHFLATRDDVSDPEAPHARAIRDTLCARWHLLHGRVVAHTHASGSGGQGCADPLPDPLNILARAGAEQVVACSKGAVSVAC